MKIRHRVPVDKIPTSDPVTPEYEAEVEQATSRAERRYRQAANRLRRDEEKLARLRAEEENSRSRRTRRQWIAELEALVELRRIELDKLHRLLVASPASSQHRGTQAGHRHVPPPKII